MPANRKKTRQPVASDYDSDTAAAALTDTQPFIPAPPVRTNEELNLLVLRRWQPNIIDILTIAPFAVVYLFSADSQGWEKCEVQGSLFLCSLRSVAGGIEYKLLILNRKGLENWELDIRSEEAIQVTDEYVIVQKEDEHGDEQIYGIWIFEEKGGNTRQVVGRAILGCAREVEALAEQQQDSEESEAYEVEALRDHVGDGEASQPGDEGTGGVWSQAAPHHQHQPQSQQQQQPAFGSPAQQQQPPFGIPQQQQQGHQIDLATLFGKSAPAPNIQPPPTTTNIGGTNFTSSPFAEERLAAETATGPHFTGNTGAAFSAQPTYPQPRQTTQQNTLLDLFKNAKRG